MADLIVHASVLTKPSTIDRRLLATYILKIK